MVMIRKMNCPEILDYDSDDENDESFRIVDNDSDDENDELYRDC